jgi:hypothetical protein
MTAKHLGPRTLFAGTIATLAVTVAATVWLAYSYRWSDAAASPAPAALPQVVVSKPLQREVDSRLGFLGQFSAVEQVELRAQVGGTLAGLLGRAVRRRQHRHCRRARRQRKRRSSVGLYPQRRCLGPAGG